MEEGVTAEPARLGKLKKIHKSIFSSPAKSGMVFVVIFGLVGLTVLLRSFAAGDYNPDPYCQAHVSGSLYGDAKGQGPPNGGQWNAYATTWTFGNDASKVVDRYERCARYMVKNNVGGNSGATITRSGNTVTAKNFWPAGQNQPLSYDSPPAVVLNGDAFMKRAFLMSVIEGEGEICDPSTAACPSGQIEDNYRTVDGNTNVNYYRHVVSLQPVVVGAGLTTGFIAGDACVPKTEAQVAGGGGAEMCIKSSDFNVIKDWPVAVCGRVPGYGKVAGYQCGKPDAAPGTAPAPVPPPSGGGSGSSFVVAAAGDIAKSGGQQAGTANLLKQINPAYILALGDDAYPDGTLAQFQQFYAPSWGVSELLSKTKPVSGNHEYHTGAADGYFKYFDPQDTGKFGKRGAGYYSFTKDNWLFLAIDSECPLVTGGCGSGSAQHQWVQQQLSANPGKCVVGYWHRPRFTRGNHGDEPTMDAIWRLMANRGAVVLNGHNHLYSRSKVLNADGKVAASGAVQFIVGTGGAELYTLDGGLDTRGIEAVHQQTWGVLQLTLASNTYQFQFRNLSNQVTDSGSGTLPCNATVPAPPPVTPPPSTDSFKGEYWNVVGAGVNSTIPTTTPDLTRNDSAVNFEWGRGGTPDPKINTDGFMARWTKTEATGGTYKLNVTADDGVRVWVNNQLVLNQWKVQSPTDYTAGFTVPDGWTIRVEYFEGEGNAVAKVSYALDTAAPAPAPAQTRNKYNWPFSKYSIWNMPIGSGAQYVLAGFGQANKVKVDNEFISLDPSAPIRTLNGTAQVRVAANLQNNGALNACTSLLSVADSNKIHQGQWLVLVLGGNPSWQYDYSIVKQSNPLGDPVGSMVSLNGPGMWGCHGGSALSGLGGAIKKGELNSSTPIHHALEYQPYCYLYCHPSGTNGKPYRWPAYRADGYALDKSSKNSSGQPRYYNGTNPELQMGSLVALLPSFNVSSLGSPHARKIAQALIDYGAYIADDAANNTSDWTVEYGAEWDDGGSFTTDMLNLVKSLHVVKNNSPTAVGGGGNPRRCYAPSFSDGTPDAVTTNPNGSVTQPAGC